MPQRCTPNLAGVSRFAVAWRWSRPPGPARPCLAGGWLDLGRLFSLVFLACVLFLAGCSNRVELFSATTDAEANEILAALLQSNVPAEKLAKKTGTAISVAEADVASALGILRQHGLPRERFEGMGKIFHKEGMISSPLEERARYIYALSQELENTLTRMDGVLVARVHVVLTDQDLSRVVKTAASAAVFIKHQSGYNLDLFKPQIRTLVAHAIPELGEDRVSVVLVPAQRSAQGVGAASSTSFATGATAPSSVTSSAANPSSDHRQSKATNTPWGQILWTLSLAVLACVVSATAWWAIRRRGSPSVHGGVPSEMPASPDGFGRG